MPHRMGSMGSMGSKRSAGSAGSEGELRGWIDDVRSGRLPRRGFVARLAALGLAAPMAALLLADAGLAQTSSAEPPYKPTKRGSGGALKLLFWQGPTLLNPHFALGSKDADAGRLFYESLARYDADANLVPMLAAELPTRQNGGLSPEGRWTLWKLKQGVVWHDGRPFTADDVVFNWRYATDPATAAITAGLYENVAAVEKVDSHTVRVVFRQPTPTLLRTATVTLVPRHLFESFIGANSRDAPGNLKPVGTGPYRFVEFRPGDLLRGEASPSYREPAKPHFATVEIKGGGDSASAARAVLQAGEYDFGWNVHVEDEVLRRMEATGRGRAVALSSGDVELMFVNVADPWTETEGERAHPKSRHPLLSQPAVRQALALLLDRQAIQTGIYGRNGVLTANVLHNPARLNSPNTKAEFDIGKANALLEGAGWVRGADGLRAKGGRKLKLVFQTSINPVRQKVQAVFKQACAKAGIEVELKAVQASVFFSSDVANPDTAGKFWADLQMFANAARDPDPDRFLQQWTSWETSSKANKWLGVNRSRWQSDEYDQVFRAQQRELDPVRRAAMLIRLNDLLCKDAVAIPVVHRPSVHVQAAKLVAPGSGWDLTLAAIADWYRES